MSNNNQDQEIDLGQLLNSTKKSFQNIINSFFDFIFFLKRKIVFLIALFVIGVGLGFLGDKKTKNYISEIIVAPNLGGSDYLYSKIEFLKSKLKENDTVFFKSIGINDIESVGNITVEPIIDIYTFVNTNTAIAGNNQNTQNFELVKLLSENEDINTVIKDEKTSKNYPHHKIIIDTDEKISSNKIILPLLNFLNSDSYYNAILKISKENLVIKMKKNEEQILQVDELITQISKNLGKEKGSSNLVYNNENTEINELFNLKNSLLNELAIQKIQMINFEVYIKDLSITPNVIVSKGINNKLKLILPFVLVFGYLFGYLFYSSYKKHVSRISNN